MKRKLFTKAISFAIAAIMIFGLIPMNVFAIGSDFESETHTTFSSTASTIAPGVTQSINYAYAKDGEQMVYFVAKADINRDDVRVQTTYKNANPTEFGMQILRDQMAAAKDKHSNPEDAENYIPNYTPVAGVNGDFFNTTTGQPSGAFVMEGVQVSSKANNRPWFAIFEDGTALCGKNNAEWDAAVAAHGAVVEAVGGSQMLVVDGADVTATASGSYNTDRHCRTMVGVTATGEVVMVALDGRQEPYSCGGTMHELAQIMLEQGCVSAINLDGGGSTTYVARQEGENEVTLVNRPSDGSERSISSGLMIVSTAAPSDVFDHASLSVENSYVTPGSTVEITAKGVSPAGTMADIPEDVIWESTLGTIDNGVFVSDGTVGDAVVSMKYDGEVVGEITIHVVIPDAIAFEKAALTVPYGESVQLKIGATYGLNAVDLEIKDIIYTLADNSIGSVKDGIFTAAVTGTQTNITATLVHDTTVTATIPLKLGKGSEVIFDFEAGTDGANADNWVIKDHENKSAPYAKLDFVTKETGMVHSGEQAMAFNLDMSSRIHGTEMYAANSLTWVGDRIELKNATSIGFWIYIPEEATQTEIAVNYFWYNEKGEQQRVTPDACLNDTFNGMEYSGWYYLSVPVTKDMAYIEDGAAVAAAQGFKRNFFLKFYVTNSDAENESSYFGNITYYIDDITIDYSDAVEDREAPVFTDIRYADETMSDAVSLKGQTTTHNVLSFAGIVHENTTKDNYTGLNGKTAKAYIDGVEVECTYAGGIIGISGVVLANGVHTVRFSICDHNGNYVEKSAKIVVSATVSTPTVDVVAKDSTLDRIPTDSIYWVDIVADEIENIKSVEVKIDLDTMHTWQLDYMDLLYGFTAEYYFASPAEKADNVITLVISRTGAVEAQGTGVLASLPIRVWKFIADDSGNTDPTNAWKNGEIPAVSVNVNVEKGVVTYLNETSHTFSAEDIHVDTEAYTYYVNMSSTAAGKEYHASHNYHVHTTIALEDVAATCTTAGYTGRTFCESCNSVVNWGTVLPATGHTYDFVDGVLKCACGKLFNGMYTDGKTYVDGVVAAGWVENSYFVNGEALTGIQLVDGYYYNFGEYGVSAGKYTGIFFDGKVYRYSQLGELSSGWKLIDNEWYYFRESTQAAPQPGYVYWDGTPYKFEENGKLISGVWVTTEEGTRYYYAGSSYYHTFSIATVAFYEIDGKIYGFDKDGYIYKDGVYGLRESNQKENIYYEFDENGVRTDIIDFYNYSGIIKTNSGKMTYYVNGTPKQMGLIKIDDYYYYVRSGGVVATGSYNCTYNMTAEIPIGVYEFDANGRMLNVPENKPDEPELTNGIVNENGTLYYYIDGVKQLNLGLIEIEDNGERFYIYVRTAGQLAVGEYKVWLDNGIVPYASVQDFGTDGKMKNAPAVKDGIVNENGTLYYYIDGVKQLNLGLIEIEENGEKFYIYVRTAGQLAVGEYKVWLDNGIVPYASVQTFDENGRMVIS